MKRSQPDYILLLLVAVLVVLGLLFLATVSTTISLKKFGTANYYLFHQLFLGLLPGIILGLVLFKTPLPFLQRASFPLLLLNLTLLLLIFFPIFGFHAKGATRWLNFGWFTVQPSEFLKLTSILYVSAWLSARFNDPAKKKTFSKMKRSYFNPVQTLFPFIVFLGAISLILTFQPNVSTLGIIASVLLIIYFASGTPIWHSVLVVLIGLTGLITLINIQPYRFTRLLTLFNPELDPLRTSFQIKQALIAVGSGGFFGRGLGMSVQKFGFLPEPMADSIFAVFAEETGLFGATLLILFLLAVFWRGLKISKQAPDKFSKLAALGISLWLIIQSFVNISSITGILPVTGIPLPFLSYGGSHLVAELMAIGILLNISKHRARF